jgi:hypothetical protein
MRSCVFREKTIVQPEREVHCERNQGFKRLKETVSCWGEGEDKEVLAEKGDFRVLGGQWPRLALALSVLESPGAVPHGVGFNAL